MKLCDIFDKSIRAEVKRLLSKTKLRSQKQKFPSQHDTPGHGYEHGSSKRFGQG